MVPGNAVKRHPVIEQRLLDVAEFAEDYPYNRIEPGDASLGIITCGVSYQYAKEVFPTASILRLGLTWPLPTQLIKKFAASVERLIVLEELDPFIEEAVRLMGIPAEGKSIFPLVGEFDPACGTGISHKSRLTARIRPHSPVRCGGGSAASAPTGALPGVSASPLILYPQQAQSAGERRYRLLHPGAHPTPQRHSFLRMYGGRDCRSAWGN